jgi:hypothetical protein
LTVCRGGERDPLREPAFVVCVEVRHLRTNHNGDADRRVGQVTRLGAFNGRQLAEHGAVADDDELPGLAIPGAARPARDLEDVIQNIGG